MDKYQFDYVDSHIVFDPSVVEPPPLERKFPVTSLALDVSGNCNMKCVYCAENSTMPHRNYMSPQVLDKALELLFTWSSKGRLSIHLGSGEPLLKPDAVFDIGKKARAMAQERGRDLSLHITTNGTLLTREICSWLVQDGWRIKISVDGPKLIHDLNRKDRKGGGTYARIEKHVQTLSSIPGFSTTSVFCHNTNPADVFYGIASLGVKNIEIVPVAQEYPSLLCLTDEDITMYRRFLLSYVQKIAKGESLPLVTRFVKKLQRVLGFGNSYVPCGAGRSFLAVAPDKSLYPCFRFVGIGTYYLGNLDTGVDTERAHKFQAQGGRPYSERACNACWAAPLCGGPCFACAELLFYKNGEPSPDYCAMVKADCEAALWLAQTLREKDPERLVTFLGIQVGED
ncbi:MAG: radical SAM protein [Theionarchaea archaeon]|nr:radical SAM protein [Theionarchaea archaeon]